VAFYALIHVTKSLAVKPISHFSDDVMAFSPSTIAVSVAAWSVSCQCSHDVQHVRSENSREAMPLGMEMESCCLLWSMCG